jgi:hypothetical protein
MRAVCGQITAFVNPFVKSVSFCQNQRMGRRRTTGSRLGFDEPLATDFLDFRAANYNAPEMEVIREALLEHIYRRLQEPEMRNRFDEARRKRLGLNGDKIRLLPTSK